MVGELSRLGPVQGVWSATWTTITQKLVIQAGMRLSVIHTNWGTQLGRGVALQGRIHMVLCASRGLVPLYQLVYIY